MSGAGDASPCRWAAVIRDQDADSETDLVDLPLCEQKARGQELLRMLLEPQSPCAAEAAQASFTQVAPFQTGLCSAWQDPDVEVRVKNTFVELVRACNKGALRRSQSDSDLSNLAREQGFVARSTPPHSPLQDPPMPVKQPRCTPEILNLSACLPDLSCHSMLDGSHDLSDASTDTPRESLEDLSSFDAYDYVDAAMTGGMATDQCVDTYVGQPVERSIFSINGACHHAHFAAHQMHVERSEPDDMLRLDGTCFVSEGVVIGLSQWSLGMLSDEMSKMSVAGSGSDSYHSHHASAHVQAQQQQFAPSTFANSLACPTSGIPIVSNPMMQPTDGACSWLPASQWSVPVGSPESSGWFEAHEHALSTWC